MNDFDSWLLYGVTDASAIWRSLEVPVRHGDLPIYPQQFPSAKTPIFSYGLHHSHVSLFIDKGFTAHAIANRMGHEAIDITLRYAHLFPTMQEDTANVLDDERGGF